MNKQQNISSMQFPIQSGTGDTIEYKVEKAIFIVESVYKEKDGESINIILLRLMKRDIEKAS